MWLQLLEQQGVTPRTTAVPDQLTSETLWSLATEPCSCPRDGCDCPLQLPHVKRAGLAERDGRYSVRAMGAAVCK
jgi:hypothetical protein